MSIVLLQRLIRAGQWAYMRNVSRRHGETIVIVSDEEKAGDLLAEIIATADRILPFTGAGISTDAGIPDFRSPGSAWTRNKPVPFDAFLASEAVRIEAWRRKFVMDDNFAGARPTRVHAELARWVRIGRAQAVVTQNIDGLHQAAGLEDEQVVELHGNSTYARCLSCGTRHELAPIRECIDKSGKPPSCRLCSGLLKSATISFGQAMPQTELARAASLARACDLCLVIGSSLVVYPAATIPVMARHAGARLVIVNREPTGLDDEADLVLRGDIAACFRPMLAAVKTN